MVLPTLGNHLLNLRFLLQEHLLLVQEEEEEEDHLSRVPFVLLLLLVLLLILYLESLLHLLLLHPYPPFKIKTIPSSEDGHPLSIIPPHHPVIIPRIEV